MSRQLIIRVPYISSIHVKRCIPLLLLCGSPEIGSFHLKSDVRYFSLLITAQASGNEWASFDCLLMRSSLASNIF